MARLREERHAKTPHLHRRQIYARNLHRRQIFTSSGRDLHRRLVDVNVDVIYIVCQ